MIRIWQAMEPRTKRRFTLAVCCGAHAVQDGLGAALYVLMPILAQAFGLSYAQIGLIRATNNCAMTFFELPSGVLSERYGERRLLVFGLICAAVGYLWLASATSLLTILFSLLVLGTGGAFQHALSSSIIANSFNAAGRRSALGLYNSSGDAGKLAFTGLFGLATGIGVAWQGIVTAFGLITLVFALIVFYTLRKFDAGGRRPIASGKHTDGRAASWGIQDRAGFGALCVTVFLDTAVQTGFLVFVVFVIVDKGVATHLAAFAVVLTLIGGMFGKAGCGYLAQRIGVKYSFALTQCATAAGILALVISKPSAAFVLLPVLGMFLQGSTSITYGSIVDLFPSNRQSRGFAMIYSVSSLSAIAGPIAFGLLSDYLGLNGAMLAMAFVALLAIPPSLLLRSRSAQEGIV